jgi:hypothetical protein
MWIASTREPERIIMIKIAALVAAVLLEGCAYLNNPENDISGRPCPPGAEDRGVGFPGCRY